MAVSDVPVATSIRSGWGSVNSVVVPDLEVPTAGGGALEVGDTSSAGVWVVSLEGSTGVSKCEPFVATVVEPGNDVGPAGVVDSVC